MTPMSTNTFQCYFMNFQYLSLYKVKVKLAIRQTMKDFVASGLGLF